MARKSYITEATSASTPQSERARGDQVKNSAGGFVFAVNAWMRLRRFLILGSEGGTYYVGQRKLTLDNIASLRECLAEDGKRVVDLLLEISEDGLAYKQDPTLYALAQCMIHEDVEVRRYASEAVHRICRTAAHMQMFMQFARESGRGWGRIMRRTVRRWFVEKANAYQLVKYQQRSGWSNRDLLRLGHVKPENEEQSRNWRWAVGKGTAADVEQEDRRIAAHELLKTTPKMQPKAVAALIADTRLPREAVPTEFLRHAEVWDALMQDMPMTALIRNLATLTRVGVVAPLSDGTRKVVEELSNEERLRAARVHPIQILAALATYESGHGARGAGEWPPVPQIVSALDDAFYATFKLVEPTGKRHLLAVDVSQSMHWGVINAVPNLTPARAAAAMAMVAARVEKQSHIMGFASEFRDLKITARDTLAQAMEKSLISHFGGTDAALPMLWAAQNNVEVDAFVVYTDNETWHGSIHPFQALKDYREKTGIDAKLVVAGMTSTGFSIADPSDAGMLDVVGFDPSVPTVLREFVLGSV